ncbi:hypothetical protein BDZ89DRAFT_1244210 [Hymenopellis radicata]|nr:hypothetical protein BDZ89DRAFT_1244210 [Hymenopellis radicata]
MIATEALDLAVQRSRNEPEFIVMLPAQENNGKGGRAVRGIDLSPGEHGPSVGERGKWESSSSDGSWVAHEGTDWFGIFFLHPRLELALPDDRERIARWRRWASGSRGPFWTSQERASQSGAFMRHSDGGGDKASSTEAYWCGDMEVEEADVQPSSTVLHQPTKETLGETKGMSTRTKVVVAAECRVRRGGSSATPGRPKDLRGNPRKGRAKEKTMVERSVSQIRITGAPLTSRRRLPPNEKMTTHPNSDATALTPHHDEALLWLSYENDVPAMAPNYGEGLPPRPHDDDGLDGLRHKQDAPSIQDLASSDGLSKRLGRCSACRPSHATHRHLNATNTCAYVGHVSGTLPPPSLLAHPHPS